MVLQPSQTTSSPDTFPSGLVLFVGVGVGYLALAQFVLWLNDPVNLGAGFWPAAGLTLGLMVLVPPRRWGWILSAVAVAEFGGDLVLGYPASAAIWWTAGNCAGPLVGATLLRRWADDSGSIVPVRELGRFLLAAVVIGPLVGATIGSIGTIFGLGNDAWNVWPKYVVGDALGVLVVAPVVLCWKEQSIRRRWTETVALTVVLLGVSGMVFHSWGGVWDATLPYLVVPPLMWAALRYGSRGAAVAIFAVTQIANWLTATGDGPFAVTGAATGDAITMLQVFLGISATATLVLAALVEDLVDRREVEGRLTRLATTDDLTGLPNRAVITAALDAARASVGGEGVGLAVCDIDHFKVVNDGLGHQAGDEVLKEIARRMRICVRPDDLVGRLGGDEFVIMMNGSSMALEALARRLSDQTSYPMTLTDGTNLTPSVSVGLAHCPPGEDPSNLLRNADAALYEAKARGRGGFHRFDDELRLRVEDRILIQTALPDALNNGEFFCVYQPEIVIATGELFSFESLSRWEHPTRGTISPVTFVPVAEDVGLIDRLFDRVLDETLEAQHLWSKRLGFHPAVAVNVSARQLDGHHLIETIVREVTRRALPFDRLWVEITESALADEEGFDTLLGIHELGVKLAIDDFGTGWSSLARLAESPWDLLKIDRSFVQALGGSSAHAEQVVRSTIAMAHSLGIPTTAEGVETVEQCERLFDLGCDMAQGYLFARPAPALEAVDFVTADGYWVGPGLQVS